MLKGHFSDLKTKETFIKKTFSWLIYKGDNYLGSCINTEKWINLGRSQPHKRAEPSNKHIMNSKVLGKNRT